MIEADEDQNTPKESQNVESSKSQANNDKEKTDIPAKDEMTVETIQGTTNSKIQASRLYFPFNSAEPKLSKSASKYFKQITHWLKESANNKIILTGHTDSIGSKKTNYKLGLQRANIIKKMLIKFGAPKAQIKVKSKGENKPLKTNKTKIGRKKNRRVELTPLN